ncbi:MAG: sugar transferase [Trueperaceae bacterium]|nr:sugar transferase [Trueperaceae bacterium]
MSGAQQAGASLEDGVRRVADVVVAALGLLVTSPLLLAAALAIKLDSRGPVLFRQRRVGLGGVDFEILKLRTMRQDAEAHGGQLTVGADPRVTRVGAFLRAWKLDELPQLINVVRGDMALVGPRPEVPRYVALYTPEQRKVLMVRPGITDPASVEFRNESELMAQQTDPERYYREVLLPRKLELNLEYLARRSLSADLGVLLATARAVLLGRGS